MQDAFNHRLSSNLTAHTDGLLLPTIVLGLIASMTATMQVLSANVQKGVEKDTKYEGNDFIRGCGLGSSSPRVAVRHPYHVVAVYQGRARRAPALFAI